MTTAIEVSRLRYAYDAQDGGETHIVFDGLDLSVRQGSFVAILGHNGCGKSTLAKHFNAVLLPSGGSVHVYGMDTKDEEQLLAIRQHVGMVFQNPDNQIVSNVVEEDVAFAPENLGVPSEEIRRRVDDALRAVGMYEYRTYAPQLLSGGQKQRVAIAGVLAMQPQCVVLDEPTAMLDPQGRREVLDTIERLNREKGITVILITHHMDEAVRAGRVIAMSEGKIIADGTPQQRFVAADTHAVRNIGGQAAFFEQRRILGQYIAHQRGQIERFAVFQLIRAVQTGVIQHFAHQLFQPQRFLIDNAVAIRLFFFGVDIAVHERLDHAADAADQFAGLRVPGGVYRAADQTRVIAGTITHIGFHSRIPVPLAHHLSGDA